MEINNLVALTATVLLRLCVSVFVNKRTDVIHNAVKFLRLVGVNVMTSVLNGVHRDVGVSAAINQILDGFLVAPSHPLCMLDPRSFSVDQCHGHS